MFRFLRWPSDRRMRLLSMAGAAVLAIMCGSAGAMWLNGGRLPLSLPPLTGQSNEEPNEFGLGAAAQAGPSASPSRSVTASPSNGTIQATASRVPLKASYKTVALLGLGGFDTEVTVRNPGDTAHEGWTVVLTMPDSTVVDNRSATVVKIEQKANVVTITPVKPSVPANGTVAFTVRFPAVLALGQSAKDCKIDGTACVPG